MSADQSTDPAPADQPPPIRVKGKPLDWSDADLDDLSEVTPADLDAAASLWRATVPADYRGLIDAVEDEAAGPGNESS